MGVDICHECGSHAAASTAAHCCCCPRQRTRSVRIWWWRGFCLLTCLKIIGISGVSPALRITRHLLATKCPRILSLDIFNDQAVSFPRDLIQVTLDAWRESKTSCECARDFLYADLTRCENSFTCNSVYVYANYRVSTYFLTTAVDFFDSAP